MPTISTKPTIVSLYAIPNSLNVVRSFDNKSNQNPVRVMAVYSNGDKKKYDGELAATYDSKYIHAYYDRDQKQIIVQGKKATPPDLQVKVRLAPTESVPDARELYTELNVKVVDSDLLIRAHGGRARHLLHAQPPRDPELGARHPPALESGSSQKEDFELEGE